MKLLALLLLAIGLLQTIAQDNSFEEHWREDVEFTEKLLNQHKRDVVSGKPLHEFPQEQRRKKRAALNDNCLPGYTGIYCESPICDKKVAIVGHDIRNTIVEKQLISACREPVTIYVDSHLFFFRISVQTSGRANPGGQLFDNKMQKIFSDSDRAQGTVHTFDYRGLVENHGPGAYTFIANSTTDDDCYVSAISATPMVVYGGFIESQFSDKVQEDIPDGDSVQKNPAQSVPSYFGFTTTNGSVNEAPKYVSFHRSDNLTQQFAPLPVSARYNCNANSFVGPYTCLDAGSYLLKVRGLDDSGNIWQRVYKFECDPNGPPGPTPSSEPVLQCENGGTLIKQGNQNVCYCGAHFTGPTCTNKVCDNGASVGLQGECVCAEGFSGQFCEHVHCSKRVENFRSDKRGITFVIRANKNDQVQTQIRSAVSRIFNYFNNEQPGSFEEYAFVLIVNGETKALRTVRQQSDFFQHYDDDKDLWETSPACEDKIYIGLDEALELSTSTKYLKSPIFLFTDATTNDEFTTMKDAFSRLGQVKSPVFTILYGGGSDTCNVQTSSEGYKNLLYLAQYSHGLVVKTTTEGDAISDTAYSLAVGFFNNNLLGGHDLIDSCQYAPEYHLFFVDESIQSITVASTGPAGLKLRVIDTNEQKIAPNNSFALGNLQLDRYITLTKGHYRLTIDTAGQTGPCTYRIYAQTHYEAFFGASTTVDTDRAFYQPIYNRDVHLVGLVNYVDFPDPENLFAEIVIWQEDTQSLSKDRRTVLYASNGVYRDDCSYNLYFGPWKCTERDAMFYVNMYVTDSSGFTVLRTTVGQCATRSGPPQTGCQHGGVSYKGKCLCTAGWTGNNCEKIVCNNGGTEHGDHCTCFVGFGGDHCQLSRCPAQNDNVQFKPKQITVALIVQNSREMVSPLLRMADVAPNVVHNLQSTHKEWINLYTFWEFDDTNAGFVASSPFADDIVEEVNDFIPKRRTGPFICKGLLVLDVLIAALSDDNASKHMEVFLYVNGGMVLSNAKLKELFGLIDELEAKINVIQSSSNKCYDDLDAAEVSTIAAIAYYSGGTYSLSNDGRSLLSLPLQYDAGNVYNEYRLDCKDKQTYYFPIESETQTISFFVIGDLKPDGLVFSTPDGSPFTPIRFFGSSNDRLYVALRPCPEGWAQVEDHCYRFEPINGDGDILTWDKARDACVAAGGVLATINSKSVDDFINQASSGFDAWIGLNQKKRKGYFEWDEGSSPAIAWVQGKSYNGFKGGSPDQNAGDCVAYSTSGWYVTDCSKKLSYVCSTNAYDVTYNPGSSKEGHLPRGLWTVQYTTFSDGEACGLRVDAQSSLQVYRRFDSSNRSDDGFGQATINFANNYQLVHVDSSIDQFDQRSTLEYAHFYPNNNPDLAFVTRLNAREHCSYEYVSDPFNPSGLAYQVAYTGFDAYGYPYQRIVPAVTTDNLVACKNGGIQVKDENRCVCPPGFNGRNCKQPVCLNGNITPNGIGCRCIPGFVGKFCQTPNCTRGDIQEPPPITNTDKTLVLLLDGSFTGYNGQFLTNFKTILDKTLDAILAVEKVWFKNYVARIVYGDDHTGGRVSDVVNKKGRADFESGINAILAEKYKAAGQERYFMNGLLKLLNEPGIAVGSPVYIITDSIIADASSFSENIENLIAQKHLTISTIILNDKKIPGGKTRYRDPQVEPFLILPYVTGGGFYQVPDSDSLAGFWTAQLSSYFSSFGVSHSLYSKCTDKTEFFQVGGADTNIIIDIFSPQKQTIFVTDPDGMNITITGVHATNTNYLFSTTATKPGIWQLYINHNDKVDFCEVAVRATRSDAPSVGFNNDVNVDRGYHSQESTYAPTAGENKNSIIAYSQNDYLRYVHVYTHDTGSLVYTSPLIQRSVDCKWNYVSKYLFTCPASSFTVAVEGSDPGGHQFRRLYKTHCKGYNTVQAKADKEAQSFFLNTMAQEDVTI